MRGDSHPVPNSVMEETQPGDIHGAFGTIRISDEAPRRTWRRRLLTLAAIVGPGLIVMVGDNDAGGVSTYAQAGQDFGYSLLWTLLLLVPVLIVNQEMVVRLGAVTGVGQARLIKERFGPFWAWFSVGGLFLLNFLIISTEFIGVSMAGEFFGFSPYVVVPISAILLIGITVTGNFRRWERAMFVFLFASLLVLPLAVLSHPDPGAVIKGFVQPSVLGGFTSNAALLIIAIVGTTVAPWQLFFQQSNVIDKRITPRWLEYEKADTQGRTRTGARFAAAYFAGCRSDLCGCSLRRIDSRGFSGDPRDLVRLRRHVRSPPLVAQGDRRREALLRFVRGNGRGGRGNRAHPSRTAWLDNDGGAGAGGDSSAELDCFCGAVVQRPRGSWSMGEQGVAQSGGRRDRQRAARPFYGAGDFDSVPNGRRQPPGGRSRPNHRGRSSCWRSVVVEWAERLRSRAGGIQERT